VADDDEKRMGWHAVRVEIVGVDFLHAPCLLGCWAIARTVNQ